MGHRNIVFLGAALVLLLLVAGCTQPGTTATPSVMPNTTPENHPVTTAATLLPGGTCSRNLSFCAQDAFCHDLATDIGNCGACGDVCPGNSSCIGGRCYCKYGYDVDGSLCFRSALIPENKISTGTVSTNNGCPQDLTPCPDNYCHNLQTDSKNCGACGNTCPVGLVCEFDTCTSPSSNSGLYIDEEQDYRSVNNYNPNQVPVDKGCPIGMTACPDNFCYFLGSDPDNCGYCGNICPAELICSGSTCMNPGSTIQPTVTPTVFISGITTPNPLSCPAQGLTYCNGGCVNTKTDPENCGTCGNTCLSPTSVCCGGKCTNVNADPSNCGACRQVCTATSSCNTGTCTPKIVPPLPKGTGLP